MSQELVQAVLAVTKQKGVAPEIIFDSLEVALLQAYRKEVGANQEAYIYFNRETGDYKVLAKKIVVDTPENEEVEIALVDARQLDKRMEIGDIIEVDVTPKNFGRSAAHTAKQLLIQRLKSYAVGDRIKCYIVEVKKTTKGPQIMISRTHPGLLKRLFELEVPEIAEGIVELKSVAREPGMRSKIAVVSREEEVDAVGACVGPKGQRVQNIVDELNGEKIDIVKWDEDPAVYIANALSPAKVVSVVARDEEKTSSVVVPDYQLSLAIGKAGQNARLAAKLTNWKIDIKSETQAAEAGEYVESDDMISLDAFGDED